MRKGRERLVFSYFGLAFDFQEGNVMSELTYHPCWVGWLGWQYVLLSHSHFSVDLSMMILARIHSVFSLPLSQIYKPHWVDAEKLLPKSVGEH